MHAPGMRKEWKYVEIGVSNGCWLCEQFLDQMERLEVDFLVSHFHSKLQPGCTCPVGVAQLDRHLLEGIIRQAL